MNALPVEACWELDRIWSWFDDEPALYVKNQDDVWTPTDVVLRRVAIITGAGTKAFSAGMDIKGIAVSLILSLEDTERI